MNQLEEDSNFPTPDANGCYKLKDLDKFIKVKGTKPELETDAKICFKNGNVTSIDGYEMKYEGGKYYINGEEYPVEDNESGTTEPTFTGIPSKEYTQGEKVSYLGYN